MPPTPPPTNSHKKTSDENGDIDGDVDMRHGDNCETKDGNKSTPVAAATSYAIHTLIRKKIVFSKRPTPIVGLSAKTT